MGSCCSREASNRPDVIEPLSPGGHPLPQNIRVFIGTWNVGDAPPGPLGPLLAHVTDACGKPADICVIAAQECMYKVPGMEAEQEAEVEAMIAANAEDDVSPAASPQVARKSNATAAAASPPLPLKEEEQQKKKKDEQQQKRRLSVSINDPSPENSTNSPAQLERVKSMSHSKVGNHWQETVEAGLPDYTVVARKGLWSMRCLVLARKELAGEVTDIRVSREATGIGSVAGNKGGIAVGLTFRGTRMLFIGSHLAAHLEHIEQRNNDFHEIVEGISNGEAAMKAADNTIEPLNWYHHVFWCGDLNYRIDDIPAADVIAKSMAGKQQELLPNDQLLRELKKGTVFAGFNEAAAITFTPTYRFLRNTEGPQREFDPWKSRVPSWCDRVLHKSLGPVDTATCLKYDAEHGVRSSDHSPVYAIYDVSARRSIEIRAANADESTKRNFKLRISDVSASDLLDVDVGSLSDPYIIFSILSVGDKCMARTRTVDDNLNPKWDKPDDVFTLVLPGKRSRADVRLRYVHCVVNDEDVLSHDAMGQAVLPLAEVVDAPGSKKQFDVPVMHGGKVCGRIKATVELLEDRK